MAVVKKQTNFNDYNPQYIPFHLKIVLTNINKDAYKAQSLAEKQIDKMCSYLAFKKRYPIPYILLFYLTDNNYRTKTRFHEKF